MYIVSNAFSSDGLLLILSVLRFGADFSFYLIFNISHLWSLFSQLLSIVSKFDNNMVTFENDCYPPESPS